MGLTVGICGAGVFASAFAPLFIAHPGVESVVVADIDQDKRTRFAERFGIQDTCESLDHLCASDVDAVAVFTQNTLHGAHSAEALRAGKDVYSAVPAVINIDEMRELVDIVEQTGQIYMMGETSYYHPATLYCRARFRAGDFGDIVYGEAQYLHDMSSLYAVYQHRFGEDWSKNAGIPPMYYPTHSTSMIVSVSSAYVTHVSCMGFVDGHDDGLFGCNANLWNNPFSNEIAVCRMSDGSVSRFNEFRRIADPAGGLRIYGTDGTFEQHVGGRYTWVSRSKGGRAEPVDITAELVTRGSRVGVGGSDEDIDPEWARAGVARVHPVHRLPREFRNLPSGHSGSHHFLVDDFVTSCLKRSLPPINVWEAARYQIPGLVAHESAMRGGELLAVADFGGPPASVMRP